MLVCSEFPIWIVWKSHALFLPYWNALLCLCACVFVCWNEGIEPRCSVRMERACVCVCLCVCVSANSDVWPVLCLLLSVQMICSFSLKPTRSMRVICQVKYCSFLLFHLTLLHWGYDNISATSCQHPSGRLCSFPALGVTSLWPTHFHTLMSKKKNMIQRDYGHYLYENFPWLFGLDLVKMKSSPSVYGFCSACMHL